ncbi:hypothetical protein NM688_g519 [Phlebia brevispora]|uniref:Uncharacterized protein n=1 Tax=Phlebia brevispora TaxID=194682 RepID=A0ACC1TED8_9APHY|nr:hypothetical protein NM688_g519 [Phlebia brevispora]
MHNLTLTTMDGELPQNNPVWRYKLRSPNTLTAEDINDLVFAERWDVPDCPRELTRIIDSPLFIYGSVRSELPMDFHVIGSICDISKDTGVSVKEDESGVPISTTYTLTLEEAMRAAADRAHLDSNIPASLITMEADPHARRICLNDFVQHEPKEEPGVHFQDENGDIFIVPDKESLPYGKALHITFRVVLCPVSDKEEDGMFATGRIVNLGLV